MTKRLKRVLIAAVFLLAAPMASGCGSSAHSCGQGTALEDGQCVVDGSGCGEGTVFDGEHCVTAPINCEEGTSYDRARQRCVVDTEIVCGTGTTAGDDGVCVPSAESCGAGLAYDASSAQCVPTDAICEPGTRFDTSSRRCVPDSCQAGEVVVDGECIDRVAQKARNADLTETENNDPALGGSAEPVVLGAVGEAAFVIAGTISAASDRDGDGRLDQDVDVYAFEAKAGDWIELSVESNGLPTPAFEITGPDGFGGDDFRRTSAIDSGSVASRQVVIPADGTYTLRVLPSLVLHSDGAIIRGDDTWGYVASLSKRAWPQAPLRDVSGGPVSFGGDFADLADNLFEIGGASDDEIITLSAEALGEDVEGVVQVWSDATTLHHVGTLVAGSPTSFEMPAASSASAGLSSAKVLVDWVHASGPRQDFEVSATVTGSAKTITLASGASERIQVNARHLDRLVFGQTSRPAFNLEVIVTDPQGDPVFDDTFASGGSGFHLAASDGDFTVEFINHNAISVEADVWAHLVESIDLGTVGSGSMSAPEVSLGQGERVYYSVSATASSAAAGQIITFEHDNLQGSDVSLKAYDLDGGELISASAVAARSNTGGFDASDVLWAYLPEDTTVLVELEASSEVTEEVLEVEVIAPGVAGRLEPGTQLGFSSASSLRAHRSGFHVVDVEGPTGFFGALTPFSYEDVDFFVHDLQSGELVRQEASSGQIMLGGVIDAAGTYLVRVECDEACAGYDVLLEGTVSEHDFGLLSAGQSASSETLSVFRAEQRLTLRVDVAGGDVLEVSHANAGGDHHRLSLYDASGNLLHQNLYFDAISDRLPDYMYWYAGTAASFEAVFEPDDPATDVVATVRVHETVDLGTLAAGAAISRTGLGPLQDGTVDFYLLHLAAGGEVVVAPTVSNGEDIDVYLYDLAMNVIDEVTSPNPDILGPTLVGAGTFLVGIKGFDDTPSYDLQVSMP